MSRTANIPIEYRYRSGCMEALIPELMERHFGSFHSQKRNHGCSKGA